MDQRLVLGQCPSTRGYEMFTMTSLCHSNLVDADERKVDLVQYSTSNDNDVHESVPGSMSVSRKS